MNEKNQSINEWVDEHNRFCALKSPRTPSLMSSQSPDLKVGRQHHHQNTKCGNIVWKNVHPQCSSGAFGSRPGGTHHSRDRIFINIFTHADEVMLRLNCCSFLTPVPLVSPHKTTQRVKPESLLRHEGSFELRALTGFVSYHGMLQNLLDQ